MSLDPRGDLIDLFQGIVDIESVSGNEKALADTIERALLGLDHLNLVRDGDTLIARTELGRPQRVVIAGHIDTVPVAANLPSRLVDGVVHGRGTVDMKGGVTVMLQVAALAAEPSRDITWIFYDHEEVAAVDNSLTRIAAARPEALAGDFAVLMEPTSAQIEGGCQGTLRYVVTTRGKAAHSARSWMGHNAIHDIGEVLRRLEGYVPRSVDVDGLTYREGMNAVDIRGGIAGNVVPDRCAVTVNFRFAPDRDEADAIAHCRALMAGYDIEVIDFALGARPGLDRPIAREFMAAVDATPVAKFGWTDVARFSALGVPAVNYGPGDPSKAHADDESCPVTDLYACRDALLRWLD